MPDPMIIAFGLGVGFALALAIRIVIGLTGIGGGSLMTPLGVGVPPAALIGVPLVASMVAWLLFRARRLAAPEMEGAPA